MRIVFFIDILIGGGAGRSVVTLFKTLNTLGVDTHLILIDPIIRTPIEEFEDKVHILNPDKNLPRFKPVKYRILAKRLKNLVNSLKPTIFISNLQYADKITYLANIRNSFFCIRSIMSKEFFKFKKTLFEKKIKILKIKSIYNNQNLITISKGLNQDLLENLKLKPNKLITIYNPFEIEHIINLGNKCNLNIPKEPYILHIGRYDIHSKRQDLLLQAYKMLNPPYKLYLLGKGDDKEKIEHMVKEMNLEKKVIIAGFDPNPYPWIKNAKLAVLTSDYEGFGRVIVESLILKTPIVSTNCPYGPDEILTGELTQLLAKKGDVEDIAQKIHYNLKNPLKIEEKHYKKFKAENIAKEYIKLAEQYL